MSIWGKVGSAASAYWRNLNIAQAGRVVRFAGKSTKAGWRSASSGLGGQISNAGRAGGTSLGKGMANWAWRGKTTAQRATRLGTVGAAGLGVAGLSRRGRSDQRSKGPITINNLMPPMLSANGSLPPM